MAIFGCRTSKEAERYTKVARRKKMAGDAMPLFEKPKTERKFPGSFSHAAILCVFIPGARRAVRDPRARCPRAQCQRPQRRLAPCSIARHAVVVERARAPFDEPPGGTGTACRLGAKSAPLFTHHVPDRHHLNTIGSVAVRRAKPARIPPHQRRDRGPAGRSRHRAWPSRRSQAAGHSKARIDSVALQHERLLGIDGCGSRGARGKSHHR